MVNNKPVIIITGASGQIGSSLCAALGKNYYIAGLDLLSCEAADTSLECDLTSDESVKMALHKIRHDYGERIAAVIHLAAYFDFTGHESPLYDKVNVEGTRRFLQALQSFKVGRFIYASTMLVHKAGVPGHKITEETPLKPGWIYPRSKAKTEKVIEEEHGGIPFTILRLAGIYDDKTAIPTLSYQIARIYEREFKGYLYSGSRMAGQAFLHKDDMVDLFVQVVDKRSSLPEKNYILAGEDSVMGYQELQNRIGDLVFGEREWRTWRVPEIIAKAGAWLEEKAEPVIPDAIDQGEKPFIKPFMIDLASNHYDLDISRARELLGWEPVHRIYDGLETLVRNLKADPAAWYAKNGITCPDWIQAANEKNKNPDRLRHEYEDRYRKLHRQNLWAHFFNMGMAFWLLTAPFILGYEAQSLIMGDIIAGAALAIFSFLSLSWRFGIARWACGAIGFWLLFAPLFFWAPTAASYLNETLAGMMVIGFSVLVRPDPGVSMVAACTGPTVPPGWNYSPSDWFQRLPVIGLAIAGFFVSRYLAAYQLGHIDTVWDPFFSGDPANSKNGTEEIITSSVSEAWPVFDAGIGAVTYALEILTGIIGSSRRWRTMPWLVVLFSIMIVPLGVVSVFFIIIQPIWIGTWCTLCLIAAAAMLIQIPYSIDELIATGQFLYRRKRKGRPLLRIFFTGDTDEGGWDDSEDDFEQSPANIAKEILAGGITLPWNLFICMVVGVWLMFTRLTLGAEGNMANADHLIGSLVITIAVVALAESARAVRFLIVPFGVALMAAPFFYQAGTGSVISSLVCGFVLIVLSFRRGLIKNSYGSWDRFIV